MDSPNMDSPTLPETPLRPIERGWMHARRLSLALLLIPMAIGLTVLDRLVLADSPINPGGALAAVGWVLALTGIVVTPQRQWVRWGYALDGEALRVVRGFLFFTDTVVPLVRVQHIDVGQGPVERLFGIGHLIVHTAGTRDSAVAVPCLDAGDAERLRDRLAAWTGHDDDDA